MIDRPAGAVNAALMPLTMRVSTSSVPSLTRPPIADATTNTREPDQQHAAAAEHVGGAAAEQQQPAVAEHVARNDPLKL